MPRRCPALAALLLFAAAAPAADKKVVLRWHGQSFFEIISTQGTRIVLDPHAIEAYGRKEVPADLVLMSHLHNDHTRTEAIPNIKQAKVINALKREGNRIDWNPVDEKFKDVRVQTLGTYHDSMAGLKNGKNGVLILDVDGLRIVHLGDLGHTLTPQQVRKLGRVDVLLVPVGGVYSINGLEAQKVVEQVRPRRYIIPMHYGTEVYSDLLDLKYFLDDQTMGVVQRFRGTNELDIDPKAAPPKEPIIAVLHWEKKGKTE
jgi:L-ascorbate metabolism protein UlaG (beta-lactamase superfamily)